MSSTVIPLNVYEVSYGTKDGKLNDEEYKKVYLKNFHKKVQHQVGDVDKLVTGEVELQVIVGLYLLVYILSAKPSSKKDY